jgi:hypothetical protein
MALGLMQPQMGTRAIWEVKVACVCDANPTATDKSQLLKKNVVTITIFPYAPRGVTGVLIKYINASECADWDKKLPIVFLKTRLQVSYLQCFEIPFIG